MIARRELDALVAEKVVGLVLTCPVDPRYDHSVGTNRDGSSAKRNFCQWPDGKESWIPFYSTDIAAAWQVVERMKERGEHMVMLSARDSKTYGQSRDGGDGGCGWRSATFHKRG